MMILQEFYYREGYRKIFYWADDACFPTSYYRNFIPNS